MLFLPKEVFKVAEINCLAEVFDSLCYEESLHTHSNTYTYVAEFTLPTQLETSQPELLSSYRGYLRLN